MSCYKCGSDYAIFIDERGHSICRQCFFDEHDRTGLEQLKSEIRARVRELEADKKLLEDDIKLIELHLKTARNDREILRINCRKLEAERDRLKETETILSEQVLSMKNVDSENDDLHERLARLVEAAESVKQYMLTGKWDAKCGHSPEFMLAQAIDAAKTVLPPEKKGQNNA